LSSSTLARITLALVVAIAMLGPSRSSADDLVISSGRPGGFYDSVARRLRAFLVTEVGLLVDIRESVGSLENLARLDDPTSGVGITFAQTDALAAYLAAHPEFAHEHVVLGEIGPECAFLIASVKSGTETLSDLHQREGEAVAVGDENSGAAVTWKFLGEIDPRLQSTPARPIDIIETLLDFNRPKPKEKIAAALIMQRPVALSAPIEIVLENPDLYRVLSIRRSDLEPGENSAALEHYSFEDVRLGFGSNYGIRAKTMCTTGLVIGDKEKLGDEGVAKIARALLAARRFINPSGR
jgi:hypothetical protein